MAINFGKWVWEEDLCGTPIKDLVPLLWDGIHLPADEIRHSILHFGAEALRAVYVFHVFCYDD